MFERISMGVRDFTASQRYDHGARRPLGYIRVAGCASVSKNGPATAAVRRSEAGKGSK
jgi:hypothetical protein